MPSLDRLAARLGGDDFALVGISQDRKGAEVYQPWLDELGVTHFETFADPGLEASRKMRVLGLLLVRPIGADAGAIGIMWGCFQG